MVSVLLSFATQKDKGQNDRMARMHRGFSIKFKKFIKACLI